MCLYVFYCLPKRNSFLFRVYRFNLITIANNNLISLDKLENIKTCSIGKLQKKIELFI